jgi:hypothetical protein
MISQRRPPSPTEAIDARQCAMVIEVGRSTVTSTVVSPRSSAIDFTARIAVIVFPVPGSSAR